MGDCGTSILARRVPMKKTYNYRKRRVYNRSRLPDTIPREAIVFFFFFVYDEYLKSHNLALSKVKCGILNVAPFCDCPGLYGGREMGSYRGSDRETERV